MKKLLVGLLGVALVMGFAITKAEAGPPAESIRMGLTGGGYNWLKLSYDVPGDPEESASVVSIGSLAAGALYGGGAGLTVGYCVNENIEVGMMSHFARLSYEMDGSEAPTITNLKFAAYFNYNYPATDKLTVFPEVLLGYTTTKIEDATSISGLMLGGGGGLKYFPIDNGSLDFGLNFIYGILKYKNGAEIDVSGLELQVKMGGSLYFDIGK